MTKTKRFAAAASAALCLMLAAEPARADGYALYWEGRPGGCRTAQGGQGDFRLYRDVTLGECQQKCRGRRGPECEAVEYNRRSKTCEVHYKRITSITGNRQSGTICYKYVVQR